MSLLLSVLTTLALCISEPTDTIPEKELHIQAEAGVAKLFGYNADGMDLTGGGQPYFGTIALSWKATERSADAYDKLWGLPSLEAGISVFNSDMMGITVKDKPELISHSGKLLTAFADFQRDLISTSHWQSGYLFGAGFGYCTRPYNGTDNFGNRLIGAQWNIYFTAGLYARYWVDHRNAIGLDVSFKHYSNGALDRPNKGLNAGGIALSYTRSITERLVSSQRVKENYESLIPDRWLIDINAGWGGKAINGVWQHSLSPKDPNYGTTHFHIHSIWRAHAALLYRYSLKYASGIGIDATRYDFQDPTMKENGHYTLGIAANHEAYYNKVSLATTLGWYLYSTNYSPVAEKKPYYESIGFNYYPASDQKFYVGIQVKAHLLKADWTGVHAGYKF
ncbi:MAG: acyloxyacyl hydrolase [Bacteroidaceae bacterium]|nr:acyloxyacyl hydrolase [Bacteroidaceae bacterium]